MGSLEEHELILRGHFNERMHIVPFEPLTWTEFLQLTQNGELAQLAPEMGERLWLKPIQRLLQYRFRIDQRNYTTGTTPTLDELTEDFKLAAAITIDKYFLNEEDLYGVEAVAGGGMKRWNHNIPQRAIALLERYERSGGRISRA